MGTRAVMDPIHFAHQFFEFTLPEWEALGTTCPKKIFAASLAPRSLKIGAPTTYREAIAAYETILIEEDKLGVQPLTVGHPDYPQAIKDHLPREKWPPLLYLRGLRVPAEGQCVAIVGTRNPSYLGQESAANFAEYFSVQNCLIVSGLAKGIDAEAHRTALSSGTVAVLGGGVGEVYPAENQALAEEIITTGGALLSQFPLRQVPLPYNFPRRNELIAALSTGVLVVEGAAKSGAAITGRQALAMGKTVVTLTQNYRTAFGLGAIRLIECGAVAVANEEEAFAAIFARIGGKKKITDRCGRKARRRELFTLAEFRSEGQLTLPLAIARLEAEISRGKIECVGPETYRHRS